MGGGEENNRGRMTQKSIKEGKKTAVDDCRGVVYTDELKKKWQHKGE